MPALVSSMPMPSYAQWVLEILETLEATYQRGLEGHLGITRRFSTTYKSDFPAYISKILWALSKDSVRTLGTLFREVLMASIICSLQ